MEVKIPTNPVFVPALNFMGRFLVLYGGSGSGKSYFAADKVIIRTLKEDRHNILCVRDTGKSVSKSQFPLMEGEIKKFGLYETFAINRSLGNELITCRLNGNKIIFSGLDDVEKLKSIYDITSIWIEEANEVSPEDFRELNRRLRGYQGKNKDGSKKYMQIIMSFNPVSELSWLKSRFFDDLKSTLILFGEKEVQALKEDPNKYGTLIIHSTVDDNHYIDEEYKAELEELKRYDEDEYNVYRKGLWGIPGGTYFDKRNLANRILAVRAEKPLRTGYFEYTYTEKIDDTSIKWVDDPEGYIRIYEDPKPGYPYVGGGDTAGEGSDWNVGAFTNNALERDKADETKFTQGQDVALLRVNYDEDLYARQMYCLGRHYNNALLGIETNFSTHPNKELERLGYPRLYIREESPDKYTGQLTKRYGFQTNKLTRPLALGMLRTVMREHPERIRDLRTLEEMTTFFKNEKGKPVAAEGHFDDCILARAINCYISPQQTDTIDSSLVIDYDKLDKLPKDLQDDYYNAPESERPRLAKKWGIVK